MLLILKFFWIFFQNWNKFVSDKTNYTLDRRAKVWEKFFQEEDFWFVHHLFICPVSFAPQLICPFWIVLHLICLLSDESVISIVHYLICLFIFVHFELSIFQYFQFSCVHHSICPFRIVSYLVCPVFMCTSFSLSIIWCVYHMSLNCYCFIIYLLWPKLNLTSSSLILFCQINWN